MSWLLPEKRRRLIRLYSNAICSREWTTHRRRYLLYLLLRPALGWIKNKLTEAGLEPDEAESEIFILVCNIFSSYNADRSCLLYHIESSVPWMIGKVLNKLRRVENEWARLPTQEEKSYEMNSEAYLSIPNILFETRWIFRDLSQYEKNLILRLLIEDQSSCKALANSCHVSKSTMSNDLQILAGRLKGR